MRQVVLESSGIIAVREVDTPSPRKGELLVRTEQVGISGADLLLYHDRHPLFSLPMVPGHEVVGVVAGLGYGVLNFSLDDRVILDPVLTCGECDYCRSDRANLCIERAVLGTSLEQPGAMAEFFTAPAINFLKADPRLTRTDAAMVEPVANALHAVHLTGGVKRKRIVVLGAGSDGLLALQASRALGAAAIVAADLGEERRSRAHSLGADEVFDFLDPEMTDRMRRQLGSVDIVFDCISSQRTMEQAIDLAGNGGTIVLLGAPEFDVTIAPAQLQDREVRFQGSSRATHGELVEAMNLVADKRIEAGSLVTGFFGLDEALEAFTAADLGTELKIQIVVS
jgi:2-desacetyl-2-hydroxyethyl bacteriochlorophyllide A dehydrogenase